MAAGHWLEGEEDEVWRQSEEEGNQTHGCEILASRIISELLIKKAPSEQVCRN